MGEQTGERKVRSGMREREREMRRGGGGREGESKGKTGSLNGLFYARES